LQPLISHFLCKTHRPLARHLEPQIRVYLQHAQSIEPCCLSQGMSHNPLQPGSIGKF
jgi:hypothetical protein